MKKFLIPVLLVLTVIVRASSSSDCINVEDYIKKNPSMKDHTAAVQQAMTDAAKRGKRVLIPGGRTYRLSDTINISGVPEIIGHGQPNLSMQNPDKDIFYSGGIWRIRIEGLTFTGGRDQIAIGNRNVDRGFFSISHCRFIKASGVGVRILKETASTHCIVQFCVFDFCQQVLVTVCDHCYFANSWITTALKNPKDLAVIENHNYLNCQDILGVPLVVSGDLRWIDNYGHTLTCRNFRFGGEGGGFTPVVNYRKYMPSGWGAHILLEDCWIGNQGNFSKKAAVYCEEFPNSIVIKDAQVMGIPPVMLSPKIDLKTYFAAAKPGMIRLDVSNNTGEFLDELPEGLLKAIDNVKNNKKVYEGQLSEKEIKAAVAAAVKKANQIPAVKTQGITKGRNKSTQHAQQMDPANYQKITMKSHIWSLNDCLDGLKERCSEELGLGRAGDRAVIVARIDRPTYPHVRVKNIEVDLEKFPMLTWNLLVPECPGGHVAVKIIDHASGKQYELFEDYLDSQFGYRAYDLRKKLKRQTGKVKIDVKIYLCGVRIKNTGAVGKHGRAYMNKKEFFIVDFLRLEKAEK